MTKSRRANEIPTPLSVRATHQLRIRLVLWSLLLVFAGIGWRLVQLQVDPHVRLSEQDVGHIGMVEIHVPRGDIRDRRGRVLATDRKLPSLAANPGAIRKPHALADHLSAVLDLDREWVFDRLTKHTRDGHAMKFVWIKRWLDETEQAALGPLDALPSGDGLMLQNESIRFYPEGDLAAHVLGFANKEGIGASGVEVSYDEYLRSFAGRRVSRVDAKRKFVGQVSLEYEPPRGGDTLHMTIDSALQYTLERRLDQAIVDCKSPRAMGILMDPQTGAILAMAARPAFDPNHYWDYKPEMWKNRAATDVFEPGSAFKIVTAGGALQHGLIGLESQIDCEEGSFNPYGHRIRDTHELGVVPFWEAFARSSNVAIVKVGAMLGPERMEEWVGRFGFGTRTTADFPSESRGLVHPRNRWSKLTMGALPIGQEVAVTMPQLARAFSAVANGGYLVDPYLVERAVSRSGEVTYEHVAGQRVRILSAESAAALKSLCDLVVNYEGGTGREARILEFRAGGKTGTGQIAKREGRGYYKDKFTAVFAGFAPLSSPRICAVIVVPEPSIRRHYGGYVCGPVFRDVVREALILLNAPEERVERLADETWQGGEDADTVVARFEFFEPSFDEPLDDLELVSPSETLVRGDVGMPDFSGMTKRQARLKIQELGLKWDPRGSGWVVHQEPPAGTALSDETLCRLIFSQRPEWKQNDT